MMKMRYINTSMRGGFPPPEQKLLFLTVMLIQGYGYLYRFDFQISSHLIYLFPPEHQVFHKFDYKVYSTDYYDGEK